MSIEYIDTPSLPATETTSPSMKRKRSTSADAPAPPVKAAKTHANHLQINYLARQFSDVLPLISPEDPLPSLLSLISDYDGVLQRHESMAGNLGARPLGPILIKRFERLFDGPPRVLKSHGKEGTTVGWLDVVEFARNKPEQFNLEKMRDGVRVCQFYTKQSRVEITEEDYQLIASGMPQKLIPPQPIMEDEEKELGTLEILEKHIGQVVQLADQGWAHSVTVGVHAKLETVSARARQLNHRLKNRRNAIIARREAEAAAMEDTGASTSRTNNVRVADMGQSSNHMNGDQRASTSPTSGFVAVNARQSYPNDAFIYDTSAYESPRTVNVTIVNGTSLHGASAATRAELLSKFFTNSDRAASMDQDPSRRASITTSRPSAPSKSKSKPTNESNEYPSLINSTSPVPIPNTPSSLLPHVKASPADRFDDSGPYKAEMVARMEQLLRGDRIVPPCDRCRRLHMDCLKNLTACMGCTKKHAKCSWKDVVDDELRDDPFVPRANAAGDEGAETRSEGDGFQNLPTISAGKQSKDYARDDARVRQGVRDEELLGEDSAEDDDQSDDPVSAYQSTGKDSNSTGQAIHTNSEPNHLTSIEPPAPHETNDPAFPEASVDTARASATDSTDPTTSHSAPVPDPGDHDLPQEPSTDPCSPEDPRLSVHAVGRSVDATPPPPTPAVQKGLDVEHEADREREHERNDTQCVLDQAVRDVYGGEGGGRNHDGDGAREGMWAGS